MLKIIRKIGWSMFLVTNRYVLINFYIWIFFVLHNFFSNNEPKNHYLVHTVCGSIPMLTCCHELPLWTVHFRCKLWSQPQVASILWLLQRRTLSQWVLLKPTVSNINLWLLCLVNCDIKMQRPMEIFSSRQHFSVLFASSGLPKLRRKNVFHVFNLYIKHSCQNVCLMVCLDNPLCLQ
jgi:hypothetical protein